MLELIALIFLPHILLCLVINIPIIVIGNIKIFHQNPEYVSLHDFFTKPYEKVYIYICRKTSKRLSWMSDDELLNNSDRHEDEAVAVSMLPWFPEASILILLLILTAYCIFEIIEKSKSIAIYRRNK